MYISHLITLRLLAELLLTIQGSKGSETSKQGSENTRANSQQTARLVERTEMLKTASLHTKL